MNRALFFPSLSNWAAAAVLVFFAATGCSSAYPPGYAPVNGSVRINGEPAEGVVVRFHHLDSSVEGNARYPVAKTDEQGQFTLTTGKDASGARIGKYKVTFEWMSSNELNAVDRFRGAMARVDDSPHQVEIVAGENNLSPFQLTWEEK